MFVLVIGKMPLFSEHVLDMSRMCPGLVPNQAQNQRFGTNEIRTGAAKGLVTGLILGLVAGLVLLGPLASSQMK